ncbi:hypothetical protein A9239_11980 [Methanosarcina sp. A14]|uniref:Uncharacterized protein n=2 Tax=Methanosarcina barkeri TaxID=2208 RepID=A0A0E3QT12_METBA|nr:hypothetical protein MSBRM_1447 [Methanosarcina barkeri MS]AKB57472.1 hypothetical protein MSBR2_0956 [Methanosarcina barkeri 227]OED06154.1 hypothetical protein A9239_11980 [Methanosarcina sp. A14]
MSSSFGPLLLNLSFFAVVNLYHKPDKILIYNIEAEKIKIYDIIYNLLLTRKLWISSILAIFGIEPSISK